MTSRTPPDSPRAASMPPRNRRRAVPAVLSVLMAVAAVAALPFAMRTGHASMLPPGQALQERGAAEAGRCTVASQDLDWHDAARDRAVPARLYLPDGACASAAAPLVVFSHGLGGSREGYAWLGRFWASHGYASLHVQHVGSDRALWRGNPWTLSDRLREATRDDEARARVEDVRFALDRVLGDGGLSARIDPARIAAAGHSYGANTTLLLAGAQVERGGAVVPLADPRIRAAIVLSAPRFAGRDDPARALGAIRIPSLHVTSAEDEIKLPGYQSPASDRVAVYEASGGPRMLAQFTHGPHSVFTDRTSPGGTELNGAVKQATQQLTLAWLQWAMDGDCAALERWPARHGAMMARLDTRGTPAAAWLQPYLSAHAAERERVEWADLPQDADVATCRAPLV